MKIDIDQIKVLLDMVGEADIAELTIEVEEERITIKKPTSNVLMASQPPVQHEMVTLQNNQAGSSKPATTGHTSSPKTPTHEGNNNSEKDENLVAITAPMVGTFYKSSSPTAAAFVQVGDTIKVGQTVCIIEAMKLMNDLPSEIAGKVVKICAENGATVEYGQQLFLVDTKV